jgi:O-antigen/teichoic acid export membrane protein
MGIVTHQLAPDAMGQFFLVQIYTTFLVGVANFGVLTGYERNFFTYEKSGIKSAQLIGSAILFVLINLLLLTFFVYLYQTEINLFVTSNKAPSNLFLILLIAGSISSLSQYYLTFFKNSGFVKSYLFFTIFQVAIYFFLSLLLLFVYNFKVLALAYAMLISNALTFIILFGVVSKKLPPFFDKNLLKELLKISIPLTPKVFFGVLSTQFDRIMLGLIGSTEAVGVYSIGQKISYTIFQFMSGLGRVFQPEVYRKLFANKHRTHLNEIHDFILPFFYVSIFFALLVAIFAKEFVMIIFPEEYSDATIVVMILSIYYSALFFGKTTGNQLIFAKKTHLSSFLMLVGVVINVGLNIPFIMTFGMIGAAWATTISGIILGIITYFVAQRYAKIIWQWNIVWSIYTVLILGIVFALTDYSKFMIISNYVSIAIKFLIVFIYIVLGFKLRLLTKAKINEIFLKFGYQNSK